MPAVRQPCNPHLGARLSRSLHHRPQRQPQGRSTQRRPPGRYRPLHTMGTPSCRQVTRPSHSAATHSGKSRCSCGRVRDRRRRLRHGQGCLAGAGSMAQGAWRRVHGGASGHPRCTARALASPPLPCSSSPASLSIAAPPALLPTAPLLPFSPPPILPPQVRCMSRAEAHLLEHPRCQLLWPVGGVHRHSRLGQDRACRASSKGPGWAAAIQQQPTSLRHSIPHRTAAHLIATHHTAAKPHSSPPHPITAQPSAA